MNRGIEVLQTFALPLGYVAVLARVAGFEPAHDGIRIRCLTAWRYPNVIIKLMGWMVGFEPTYTGATTLGLNHLTTPTMLAIFGFGIVTVAVSFAHVPLYAALSRPQRFAPNPKLPAHPVFFALGFVAKKKKMAIRTGLEPVTSSVTGWHSNQLNYRTAYWWGLQGSNL